MQRTFLAVEGNEGAGKSCFLDAAQSWAAEHEKKVFDLVAFGEREHRLPTPEELDGSDILLSREPSPAWIGEAIRQEVVVEGRRHYSGRQTAEAFALDRLVLYGRVLIPAFERGIIVISDRSVASSLVYQPMMQDDAPTVEEIAKMPGNRLALTFGPTHLVVMLVDPEEGRRRLAERREKIDNAIFERLTFMQKLYERYQSTWFQDFWKSRGTEVTMMDTTGTQIAHTRKRCTDFISTFFLHLC
jgi:thymidylate kinase